MSLYSCFNVYKRVSPLILKACLVALIYGTYLSGVLRRWNPIFLTTCSAPGPFTHLILLKLCETLLTRWNSQPFGDEKTGAQGDQ